MIMNDELDGMRGNCDAVLAVTLKEVGWVILRSSNGTVSASQVS
jgi:hypothetical protein